MAIWPPATGNPRLAFGIHSSTGGVRQANAFYKNEFR
jgi:hypothetical protein